MNNLSTLERLLLESIAKVNRDAWVPNQLGGLIGRVQSTAEQSGLDFSSSGRELIEACIALEKEGLLSLEIYDGTSNHLPLKTLKNIDQIDIVQEFIDSQFRIKLTHDGRKALDVIQQPDNPPALPISKDDMDDLLPIFRRKLFDDDLPIYITNTRQHELPLSMLMIDIDHFKSFNDKHGHDIGNQVLISVASILSQCVGDRGRVYRVGGEEIICLLPNFSVGEATALGERMRSQNEQFPHSENNLKVTVSIGVATIPTHAETEKELTKHADQTMYKAKTLGRNLVRVYGEADQTDDETLKVPRRQPQPNPKLSQRTVGAMVQIYQVLHTPLDHNSLPLLSTDAIHNALYEKGVEASVLEYCGIGFSRNAFSWNFQNLLSNLFDGRFFFDLRKRQAQSPLERSTIELSDEDTRNGKGILLKFIDLLLEFLPTIFHVSEDFERLYKELIKRVEEDGFIIRNGKLFHAD